jgi:N-acetylglucosaminyldiphosphoundecaprenol N-acetyl-beta-D-mannosaminyltransferase
MPLETRRILGVRIHATSYQGAAQRVLAWGGHRESRYVCLGVVASIVAALDSPAVSNALEEADLVTADGMPLVWMLRLMGIPDASRVYGPDLTLMLLEQSAAREIPVAFYGSTPEVIQRLTSRVRRRFPKISVAYCEAPRFGSVSEAEDQRSIDAINASGARILFVGLGGAKQDLWMAAHRGRIQAVMLGVGAAFDFLAGTKPQAPRWMQGCGLEWLFRFVTEPRRLWRRYLLQNPRFAFLAIAQLLRARST